jgi:hypothetical protein
MKRKAAILLALGIISSCAFAQQAAKEFVLKQRDTSTNEIVYIAITDSVFHANETISQMPNFEQLDKETQDSLIKKYTIVSDKVQDSVLLRMYKEELAAELQNLGFKVIITQAENFPDTLSEREHTLNIVQLELEEFAIIDSIFATNKNQLPYVYHKTLSGVRFNSWLIYNEKDSVETLMFFCDEEVVDDFYGQITFKQNEPKVDYSLTKINPNDAYDVAFLGGRTSAVYFYNFLMNGYVFTKTSAGDNNYYGIDLDKGGIIVDREPFDNFDVIGLE